MSKHTNKSITLIAFMIQFFLQKIRALSLNCIFHHVSYSRGLYTIPIWRSFTIRFCGWFTPCYMKFKSKKYSIDSTDYQVGQDNVSKWGMDIHSNVFSISIGLSLLFIIILLALLPSETKDAINTIKNAALVNFDFVFMWGANILLLFAIGIAVSPLGKIRLGGDKATTDYSTLSWVSMLFAAGMGIGLIFWGVAEPTAFYTDWAGTPLNAEPFTEQGREIALGATVFH